MNEGGFQSETLTRSTLNRSSLRPIHDTMQHDGIELNIESSDISIEKIMKMVKPTGVCKDLGLIRVNQQDFRRSAELEHSVYEDQEKIIALAEQKVSELKPVLSEMMQHDEFLANLARKTDNETVTRDEIKQILNIHDLPSAERLYLVINQNIDPELLPVILDSYVRLHGMPKIIHEAIERNAFLRHRVGSLLANDKFFNESFNISPGDGGSFSPELNGNIQECVSQMIYEMERDQNHTKEQVAQAESYLNNMFNLQRNHNPSEDRTAYTLSNKLRLLTSRVYFESRNYYMRDERFRFKAGISDKSWDIPRIEIRKHAIAVQKGKYLLELWQKTDHLYKSFFPEVYVQPQVELLEMTDPHSPFVRSSGGENTCEDTNGHYDHSKKEIGIKSATALEKYGGEAFEEQTIHFAGPRVKRRVADSIIMLHEDAHDKYQSVVWGNDRERRENYHQTADHALNEGYCVTMELLFIDQLKANPGVLGLDEQDITDLEACKQARLYQLKSSNNGYTEGTYRILHKVYEQAAGPITRRDLHKGLIAISEFIKSINKDKSTQTLRTEQEYLQLLRQGDPDKLKEFFSSPPKLSTVDELPVAA